MLGVRQISIVIVSLCGPYCLIPVLRFIMFTVCLIMYPYTGLFLHHALLY